MIYGSLHQAYGWPGLIGATLAFGLLLYGAVAGFASLLFFAATAAASPRTTWPIQCRYGTRGGNTCLMPPIQLAIVYDYSKLCSGGGVWLGNRNEKRVDLVRGRPVLGRLLPLEVHVKNLFPEAWASTDCRLEGGLI